MNLLSLLQSLTGHTDPPAWSSGCSVDLILDITVIWGGGELGIGWQDGVDHHGEQQPYNHLHTSGYLRRQMLLQASMGKVQSSQVEVKDG